MIASGRRNAARLHGELYVVHVEQLGLTAQDRASLERNLDFARAAGAQVAVLRVEDPVRAILDFAAERRITQIFIGHSQRRGWWAQLLGNPVDRLIRSAENIDVQVFPH
jgi:two-component system sensor histidine kinase KdpD